MSTRNKLYFASDFHLGTGGYAESRKREDRIVSWLDSIKADAAELFLMGDVFDFWFEYKYTVPKGFIRLLGKIAEITDSGTPVHLHTGNHDMWMFGYLPKEIGVIIHTEPIERTYSGKTFFIGHGDGLGPDDHSYKFIKKVFANKFCQWLFARLHPNLAFGVANYFSSKSRIATGNSDSIYLGDEKEWLVSFCKEKLQEKHFDYFIFGHRHLPIEVNLPQQSKYINLGEWINYYSYAEFDGVNLYLKEFK